MTSIDRTPETVRRMAREIIACTQHLTYNEGRFLGGLAFATREISERQRSWLRDLYERYKKREC